MSKVKEAYVVEDIGNYYGGLTIVATYDNKYYWSIENWDGHNFIEISEILFLTIKSQVKVRNPEYSEPRYIEEAFS